MTLLAKRAAALGFLTFLTLWIVGFFYTVTLPYPEPTHWVLTSSDEPYSPRQQQMSNNLKQLNIAEAPLPAILDKPVVEQIQVYEKFAHLSSGTAEFEDDELRLRSVLADYKAAVLNERSQGVGPHRRLSLEVGVRPEDFDAVVERLRQIGHLDSISEQRRDRTGEFRKLNAQRHSLKKHLESIQQLRAKANATFDDQLRLEQKVQEIEKELQTLGVQLGDFLGRQSYYQINLTLYEYQPGSRHDRTFTVAQRVANAFVWALGRWVGIVPLIGLCAGTCVSVRTLVRR